jgi:ribose-phosphate pyrophosphokinase
MKILNLTNLKTSDIKFEVSKFPDGQQQVVIINYKELFGGDEYEFGDVHLRTDVQIKARLNNFKDLELIICAAKSLREIGVEHINLYTPYFLGSRSDRKFEEGSNNYLKDVICPIINSLKFDSVTVLDPHSDVLEACLNNFKKFDNFMLVSWVKNLQIKDPSLKNTILISPDAGANKKIFKIAEQIGYTGDIITCSKSRDINGKISRVTVPIMYEEPKDVFIIDDICDGGATFKNIAASLNDAGHFGKKYLIVTHGIFSKGFKELNQYFDGIYCTNSYSDVADNEYDQKTNVKQLNVF